MYLIFNLAMHNNGFTISFQPSCIFVAFLCIDAFCMKDVFRAPYSISSIRIVHIWEWSYSYFSPFSVYERISLVAINKCGIALSVPLHGQGREAYLVLYIVISSAHPPLVKLSYSAYQRRSKSHLLPGVCVGLEPQSQKV